MEPVIPGNSYHTDPDKKRVLGDRLALGTRWYFIFRYLCGICRYARQVRRGEYDARAWVNSSREIFTMLEDCGARFHIEGMDNIARAEGPIVFIANHMSTLETQILPMLIEPWHDLTFVVKDGLLNVPMFGPILGTRKPVIAKRENPREDLQAVLQEGKARLEAGMSITIFPQSTRSPVFDPEHFNSLGIKLARRASVPIIPIALKTDFWANSHLFLKDLGPLHRSRPVHFAFGEPLDSGGKSQEIHNHIVTFISSNLKQWQDQ